MATWQQNINSGGFLGGIGKENTNAPQASDANATIGLIRQNNDFARSGGNNIGLQALQGLSGVAQAYQQNKQQEMQSAFNQAHANAWKSGDTSALRDFAVQNPAFVQQAQQAVSGLDKSQLSDMTNQAAKLRMALAQGPEAYTKYIGANSGELTRIGADPNFLVQAGTQNPQAAAQFFDTLGMAGSGDKYYDILDKRESRQIDRGKLAVDQDKAAETARSNRVGEAQGWANVGIAQQNADIRRSELREQALNRQVAREGNELRQEQLRQEMASNREKSMQAKTDVVGAYDSQMNQVNNMLDTVNQVKGNGSEPQQGQPDPRIKPEVFDRIFGFGGSVNSMVPGSESADAWQKIQQMQGQARLMGVIGMKGSGPVSDSEGQAAAKAFLSINQSMSPNAARAAINNWEQVLRRQEGYLNKQRTTVDRYRSEIDTHNQQQQPATQGQPQNAQQQGGYSNLWGG